MKLQQGQPLPHFLIRDIENNIIDTRDWKGKKIYLTMLRNTACPLCSFHVFKLLKMTDRLKAQNMHVVAFYESKKQVILSSQFFKEQVLSEKKLTVVSDTDRQVYSILGAEIDAHKASLATLERNGRFSVVEAAAKAGFTGDGIEQGTHADAIPADFLINEKGIIEYAHYGIDSGDNINLDIVSAFAEARKD